MTSVYIAFYQGTAWYSKIIAKFTKGWSHVAFVYFDPRWGWMQLGSEMNGWVFLPTTGADIAKLVTVPPGIDIWKGLFANRKWLGTRYDFEGLVGMSWVMVMWEIFKRKVKNPLQSKTAWFCSEICAQVLRDGGAVLSLEPGETDPQRFDGEVMELGSQVAQKDVVFAFEAMAA